MSPSFSGCGGRINTSLHELCVCLNPISLTPLLSEPGGGTTKMFALFLSSFYNDLVFNGAR